MTLNKNFHFFIFLHHIGVFAYYLCSVEPTTHIYTLSIMKNIITTPMLKEFMSLDRDEQEKVLQFCKDSESMTDAEVVRIKVTTQGSNMLRTLQRKAVRRAKNAIRSRERKAKDLQKAPTQPTQPRPQFIQPVEPLATLFEPGQLISLSNETNQRIEWATNTFPREIRLALSQKIDHIIYTFSKLPVDDIQPAQEVVYRAFSQIIDKILSRLLAPVGRRDSACSSRKNKEYTYISSATVSSPCARNVALN